MLYAMLADIHKGVQRVIPLAGEAKSRLLIEMRDNGRVKECLKCPVNTSMRRQTPLECERPILIISGVCRGL